MWWYVCVVYGWCIFFEVLRARRINCVVRKIGNGVTLKDKSMSKDLGGDCTEVFLLCDLVEGGKWASSVMNVRGLNHKVGQDARRGIRCFFFLAPAAICPHTLSSTGCPGPGLVQPTVFRLDSGQ